VSAQRASASFELPAHGAAGHRCTECESRLCARVEGMPGVSRVECDASGPLRVEFDPTVTTPEELDAETRRYGAELEGSYVHAVWRVTGLDCPDCARTAAKSVQMLPGVLAADLNFASGTLLVEYEPQTDPRAAVVKAVEATGHGAEPLGGAAIEGAEVSAGPSWWTRNRTLVAVVGSGAFTALAVALGWLAPGEIGLDSAAHIAAYASCVIAVLFGWVLLGPRAWSSLKTRSIDMNVLMLIAVTGAFALGDVVEAASVVFLYSLGGWLESRALARTRSSIRDLMELAPLTARVVGAGEAAEVAAPGAAVAAEPHAEVAAPDAAAPATAAAPAAEAAPAAAALQRPYAAEVALDAVPVGALIRIRPGERIPLDGVVTTGFSAVDEAPITGEPLPAEKREGDRVFAGSLNTTGLLEVRVSAAAKDSTLARVVQLVEQAQAAKAPVQQLVDRFSRVYTPAVVVLAIAVALVPPLLGLGAWSVWATRALVLLVVACPCALVISTPVSLVSAISRAGRDGVLVKGGAYLEVAARIRAVAFDKTGTLTAGRPKLAQVRPFHDDVPVPDLLAVAAAVEQHSNHPIARAVLEAAVDDGLPVAPVTEFEELPGRGVQGVVHGELIRIVSPAFAEEIASLTEAQRARILSAQSEGRTVLVVVHEAAALGLLGVEDPLREEAGWVVGRLHDRGVEHTVMLTGDNEATAAAVAERAGLIEHMAGLLPADKVEAVLRLKERFGAVAMVGDGVNDAPALAASDLGIAMGAAGSDTALATADVALMADDLSALPGFFELGRRTLRIIKQNVGFSVLIKVVVLVAAVFGYANMWLAVFADTGVALLVILNGMRLLRPRRS
jgi:Cd2+/Zn2+-exporting ATPase